ncbi:DMT family transporter [soil metagenome]
MRLWPYLLLTVAGVAWGFGFPLGKFALRELSPAHLIELRLGLAGVVALPYALARPEGRRLLRDWRSWITGGFYGLGFLIQFEGLARISVSLAALLIGLMPALIAVASVFWGERVSPRAWSGVACATLGGVLIALTAGSGGGSLLGVALSVISLLVFVGYMWTLRTLKETRDLLAGPAAVLVTGGVTVLAIGLPLYGPPPLQLGGATWAAVWGGTLVCTVLATACWQIGAVRAPAASAGVFINMEPLVGAGIGVAMFGDRMTPLLVGGGVLILVGSLATVLSHREPETPPTMA